jgi:hypothetical protein
MRVKRTMAEQSVASGMRMRGDKTVREERAERGAGSVVCAV